MKSSIWSVFSLLALICMTVPAGCGGGNGGGQLTATHFSVSAQGNAVAGTAFNFTVTALDSANNVVTTYSGTVHFTSTDPQAILPANSKLTNGVGNFSATFKNTGGQGQQSITATDTVTASITGTSPILVTGPAASFTFNVPSSTLTGTAFNFTVTAIDSLGNVAVGYSGTVHFTSSDTHSVLPADSKLTNGVGNFSATLKTAGGQTLTATDTVTTSITGTSASITVPGPATHFSVKTSPTARAGTSFLFSVTARDAANNVTTTYSGTVHFTSTDLKAVLPGNSMLLMNGVGDFQATLNTVGVQTIVATDTVTTSITGTSNAITVFTGACGAVGDHCTLNQTPLPCCPGLVCSFGFCTTEKPPPELKTPSRFAAACTMEVAREFHSSTLLNIGLVLIAGGDNGSFSLAAAELFNPETRTFAPAGDLASARARHTATSLPNGTVLITGGRDILGKALASAEIFNTDTMSFAPASSMTTVRESHTSTLLRNGKVLLAGGNDGNTALASAELFDRQTGSFTPIASMNRPRSFHTATLLKDGKVLVVGGQDAKSTIFATAEIFDPATGRFTLTGQMSTARELHTATLLEDGRVLIAGGDNGNEALATAELFDPETGKFSSTGSMQQSRESHTATLRDDGTVLVVGGNALISGLDGGVDTGLVANSTATAELFDPSNGSFQRVGEMSNPRANHTATLLPDGIVIVIGGALSGNFSPAFFLSSAELFQQ